MESTCTSTCILGMRMHINALHHALGVDVVILAVPSYCDDIPKRDSTYVHTYERIHWPRYDPDHTNALGDKLHILQHTYS